MDEEEKVEGEEEASGTCACGSDKKTEDCCGKEEKKEEGKCGADCSCSTE